LYSAKIEIRKSLRNKANVISSSPFEYELLKKLNFQIEKIHNASLVRYERFQYIKKNKTEKICILASFTYRSYNKSIFEKSLYKKNLLRFLNDKELIAYLTYNNIDLIYIPHHEEIDLGKNYSQNNFKFAKIKKQGNLEYYIEQCSLFITDFSSIAFDFMFQNKPVLYYAIDKNEKYSFKGKEYLNKPNDTIFFGNYFSNKDLLINKIKYYINRNFTIENKLKNKYESVFFIKRDIITKLVKIINNITKKNNKK
jgi:CDP-glycerol glycerophosphotransferase (TagB/SpsB family)